MYAKIVAHKGYLVCELLVSADVPNGVATTIGNPGRFGQVIMNTPANLGVSEEALELLRSIPCGRDSIGDVDWFATDRDTAAFSWIGPPKHLIKAKEAVGSSTHLGRLPADRLRKMCVIIANDVSEEAVKAIEAGG